MATTLGDLRGYVYANVDRSSAPSSENATINRFVNQVIREVICTRRNWEGMETEYTVNTAASTENYLFAGTNGAAQWKDTEVILIRLSASQPYYPLHEISENQARYMYPTTTVADLPVAWFRRAKGASLRPIPDQVYGLLIIGWQYFADLSADGDNNDITNLYPRLIELWATSRAFLHYGEDQKALVWRQMAEKELEDQVRNDVARKQPAHHVLSPSVSAGVPGAVGKRVRGRPIQPGTPYFGWP